MVKTYHRSVLEDLVFLGEVFVEFEDGGDIPTSEPQMKPISNSASRYVV